MTLAGRLRARRVRAGMTPQALARRAGLGVTTIRRLESGRTRRPRDVDALAAALGVTPAWLLHGDPVVVELDAEALEMARAWTALREPLRSALKDAVVKIGELNADLRAQDHLA